MVKGAEFSVNRQSVRAFNAQYLSPIFVLETARKLFSSLYSLSISIDFSRCGMGAATTETLTQTVDDSSYHVDVLALVNVHLPGI